MQVAKDARGGYVLTPSVHAMPQVKTVHYGFQDSLQMPVYGSFFTVEELPEQTNMSVSLFHQKFKSAVGMGSLQC